jgi:hypothetical protein
MYISVKKPLEKWTTWKRLSHKKYKTRKLQNTKHLKVTAATRYGSHQSNSFPQQKRWNIPQLVPHICHQADKTVATRTQPQVIRHRVITSSLLFSAPKCLIRGFVCHCQHSFFPHKDLRQLWWWRKLEKINWTYHAGNEEGLQRAKEEGEYTT